MIDDAAYQYLSTGFYMWISVDFWLYLYDPIWKYVIQKLTLSSNGRTSFLYTPIKTGTNLSQSCNMWLLLPLHHLCGFLSCYSVIDVRWMLTAGLLYLNHLAPLCAALRRSRVAQCHHGVVGGVPNPTYSLLSWVQRFVAKVNTIHWLNL